MARAGCTTPLLDEDDLAYTRTVIEPHLDATDRATVIACLFGDTAANALGYPPQGLSDRAGLALALDDARTEVLGETVNLAFRRPFIHASNVPSLVFWSRLLRHAVLASSAHVARNPPQRVRRLKAIEGEWIDLDRHPRSQRRRRRHLQGDRRAAHGDRGRSRLGTPHEMTTVVLIATVRTWR